MIAGETCRLTVSGREIGDEARLRTEISHPSGYAFRQADCTDYHECDCSDFQSGRHTCAHLQALVAAGVFDRPRRWTAAEDGGRGPA
jgi:hypothetical protein